jgi:pimeloyl-ACP methyl ester carboxylesterase
MNHLLYNNRKLAYQQTGQGEPVILVHGFCEDSWIWNGLTEALKDRYQVITLDLPGYGDSETGQEGSIEYMAAAVLAVADELKLDTFSVIGHSMGGYVSLALAERAPGRIKKLGLFHSHPFADSPEKKEARTKAMEFVEKEGHEIYVEQLIPKLFETHFRYEHDMGLLKQLIQRAVQAPAEAILQSLAGHARPPGPKRGAKANRCSCIIHYRR